mgnify:FL=1
MGYTTEFSGSLTIVPPLSAEEVTAVNDFCSARHGGDCEPHAGMPGLWCDWEASYDGAAIRWNGNEKSCRMPEWLEYLVSHFFAPRGHTVDGRLEAHGEDPDDTWVLECRRGVVSRRATWLGRPSRRADVQLAALGVLR